MEGKVFPMKREKEQKAKAWGRDAHSTSGNHKWEKFTVSLKAWSRVWREAAGRCEPPPVQAGGPAGLERKSSWKWLKGKGAGRGHICGVRGG